MADQRWIGVDAVTVQVTSSAGNHRVAFSSFPSMASPVFTTPVTPDARGVSRHSLPALPPGITCYYQVEDNGSLVGPVQSFRTLPGTGVGTSFTFAFASCRRHSTLTPDPPIMVDLLNRQPNLFIQHGDFHYRQIATNDPALFRTGFDELFTRTNIYNVLAAIPTNYTWSDQDFCGDNSDGTAVARPAATTVYRERVPHPTLPDSNGGIYHTYRIGRVRFIVLDTRSYRSPYLNTDNSSKTMLGAEQKAWLQGLLGHPDVPLTFIVSAEGWIGNTVDNDHWAAYQTERTQIGSWITDSATTKIVFLCGDAHMLAYDDGTNAVANCPTWHAAPLNAETVAQGGPYSGGTYTGGPGYGFVTVTDSGTQITATYQGIKLDGTVWGTHTVNVSVPDSSQAGVSPADTPSVATIAASTTPVELFPPAIGVSRRSVLNSSSSLLYLKYGSGASTTSYSVPVPAGKLFTFPHPTYTGRVTGVWSTANGNVRCTEVS